MTRQIPVTPLVLLAAAALAPHASGAPPQPTPASHPTVTASKPTVGVLARPDLAMTSLTLEKVKTNGTLPDGQPCWIFNLQLGFRNVGTAGTGPFKVVWERADAQAGVYAVACQTCTLQIPGMAAGTAWMAEPRQFNNCSGTKWYRVRLDPDNAVRESREDNNSRTVQF